MKNEMAEIFDGAVDLHSHPAPAPFPREYDIVEAAKHYAEAGFFGAVAKSHHHPSTTDIDIVKKHGLIPHGFTLFGSLVLNASVGGLNPWAVDVAVNQYGAKVVWLPTVSARNHKAFVARGGRLGNVTYPGATKKLMPDRVVEVVDERGVLLPEVDEIIGLVRDGGAILATGHISPGEIMMVLERGRSLGLDRIVVTHPMDIVEATLDEALRMVELGAYLEHMLGSFDPGSAVCYRSVKELAEWIRAVGADRTILVSDAGLRGLPWPVDAARRVAQLLIDAGISAEELRTMWVVNPRALVGAPVTEVSGAAR